MIERGELRLAQTLDHGKHGGVDEADAQIGVGDEQRGCAAIVLGQQILDDERSAIDLLKQRSKRPAGAYEHSESTSTNVGAGTTRGSRAFASSAVQVA